MTIFLGPNDAFWDSDETIDSTIDKIFEHYDQLISMVHGVRKDTKIGAFLMVPPAATQDAFGQNYKCNQTRWQYKRNQHRVVERMTKHYGGREKEYLFLVPTNVNLDCARNYPQETAPWNARTEAKGTRLHNGVHPAGPGYVQIGDSLYCWLKARLAEQAE